MSLRQCVKKCAHFLSVAIVLKIMSVLLPDITIYYFTCTANFILYVTLATITYNFCKHLYNNERVESDKKAVLITGCDSGFGNRLAKKLDSEGFQVFASCLFPEGEGASQLKQSCSDRLHVLYLDVTKDETVEKALEFVKNNLGTNVLWAIVNNAGTLNGYHIDFSSIDHFKDSFDVNALGPVRVTKAFLPLLKKSKGRVVNVTSLGARLLLPELSAYLMSKSAALAFTEILSLEMNAWGVRAISIEPEMFGTSLCDPELYFKRMEVEMRKIPTDVSSCSKEYLDKRKKAAARFLSLACSDIDIVVDTIVGAVTHKCPDHVYKPARNIFFRILYFMLEAMPFEAYEQLLLFGMKIIGYPLPKNINSKRQNL